MFNPLKITPFIMASTVAIMAVQSVNAQTPVTGIKINQNTNKTGLEIILETTAGNNPGTKPQVFTLSRDNQFTADIINAKLNLPNGNKFNQNNPVPGVSSITINQLDSNSIRMIITGEKTAPNVEIVPGNPQNIGFSVKTADNNGVVGTGENPPVKSNNTDNKTPTNTPITVPNNTLAQNPPKTPTLPNPTPLVPNPDIKIDGNPAGTNNNILEPVSPAPPLLPRAIAPPVGDIAVSNIDVSTPTIDLGSNAPVRLVLKEAPAKDVLTLLARTAGLNVVFIDGGTGTAGAVTTAANNMISLDIDNEPVQNVFNYVLRMSGLEGNRSDRTIFIGKNLPDATKNIVMRTMRLNQLKVTMPETQLSTSQNSASNISSSGQGSSSTLGRTSTSQQNIPMRGALQILEAMGANSKLGTGLGADTPGPGQTQSSGSAQILKGLQVTADARTNTITLIGLPNLVEIASAHLVQLDVRKRQVAVNVKIIEVNLLNNESVNTSFGFAIGDNYINVNNGDLTTNIGPSRVPTAAETRSSITSIPLQNTGFTNSYTLTQSIPFDTSRSDILSQIPLFIRNEPTGANTLTNAAAFTNDPAALALQTFSFTPGTAGTATTPSTPGTLTSTYKSPTVFQTPSRLLANLQAKITSGNGKILTDPTLIVQEGSQSQFSLTAGVLTGRTTTFTYPTSGPPIQTTTVQTGEVGVILNINVDQIDDNGFINLSVSPEVSSPGSREVENGNLLVQLINRRRLETGNIRLRDGQTLILTGIIQETDQTTVSKVPILGDIPLIGSLFRSTNRQNQRQEVVVLVTPQVMDDSDRSSFGYNYTPGNETRQFLQQRGFPIQGK